MDTFLTIVIIAIGILLVVWLFRSETKKKQDVWTGVLEDKKVNKYLYKGKDRVDYLLFFRKDSGNKVTYNATEEVYNAFSKGDKAEKRPNEYFPVKLNL